MLLINRVFSLYCLGRGDGMVLVVSNKICLFSDDFQVMLGE